uniref:Tudor domain-containing protein 1/4/6/7 n=1 Tax=Rhipicephalus appendiculatus TaxID=34631 RepID=A0A131Z7H3_RHIAP
MADHLPETAVLTPKQVADFVARIGELVSHKRQGLWSSAVPKLYLEQYHEPVPKNWLEIIKNSEAVCVAGFNDRCCILYPRTSAPASSQVFHDWVCQPGAVETTRALGEKLLLPSGNNWDVYVTSAVNAAQVYIRLLSTADEYTAFTEELTKYYASFSRPAYEPVVSGLYATNIEGRWTRVKVRQVQGEMAEVFLVDRGDVEKVPRLALQKMDPNFLRYPFQVVRCRLAELEDLQDDEELTELVKKLLVGRCLHAVVKDRKPEVTATFYDKSSGDVNLNALLVKSLPAVQLPETEQMTSVRLSHIDQEMCLYVQLQCTRMNYVTRRMEMIGNRIRNDNHQPAEILRKSKLYACRKEGVGAFYRALLLSGVRTENDKVLVRLVDTGEETLVYAAELFDLVVFGETVMSFPHQAIGCRLADVAPDFWTPKTISLLKEMIPVGIYVLLKVVTPGKNGSEPLVSMFKRIGSSHELISVNATLTLSSEFSRPLEKKSKRRFQWPPAARAVLQKAAQAKSAEENKKLPVTNLGAEKADMPATEVATNGDAADRFLADLEMMLMRGPKGDGPDISSSTSQGYDIKGDPTVPPMLDDESWPGKPLPVLELPTPVYFLDVKVIDAVNPHDFTFQFWDKRAELKALMSEMQSFYAKEGCSTFPRGLPEPLLRKGHYYAGYHSDQIWYRVLVQKVQGPLVASVYFVDYGRYGMMLPTELQPLWKQFRRLPVQAVHASLARVAPLQKKWTPKECITFREIVNGKVFVARVLSTSPDTQTGIDGAEHLVMDLVDTAHEGDIYIEQVFAQRRVLL